MDDARGVPSSPPKAILAADPRMLTAAAWLPKENADDPTIRQMASALGEVTSTWAAIISARDAQLRDVTQTRQAALLKTSSFTERHMTRCTKLLDDVRRSALGERKNIETQIEGSLRAKAGKDVLAMEIRAHMKALKAHERAAFCNAAIDNGDMTTIATFLLAPHYLSGLSKAEQDILRDRWKRQAHPDACTRADLIGRAVSVLETAGSAFLAEAIQLVRSPEIDRARELQTRAKEALKG